MATLDSVRVLQKRARDKEYRIRKQAKAAGYQPGAEDVLRVNIAKVSPRQDWKQVQAMSPAELNKYAAKLNQFNKTAKYVGSESGDVIPKKYLDQASRLIKSHNKFVKKERARIEGIAPDLWKQYRAGQEGILKQYGIGGLLTEIDTSKIEPPRSLEVAKRRVRSYERANKRDFAYYRKIQRRNMMQQLFTIGEYDLAELVRSMTSEQFDVLSSVLPMWQKLELEYYDPTNVAQTREDVRSYVYKAWAVTSKDPDEKVIDRLNRTFFSRDAAGRAYAKKTLEREQKVVAAMSNSERYRWSTSRSARRAHALRVKDFGQNPRQ